MGEKYRSYRREDGSDVPIEECTREEMLVAIQQMRQAIGVLTQHRDLLSKRLVAAGAAIR